MTQTISLTGTKLDTVKITDISIISPVPDGLYTWKLNDGRPRGLKSITCDITLHPEKMIPGKFNHTLQIKTDLDIANTIDVRLSGEVTGPLNSDPRRILFSNYEIGVPLEEKLTIMEDAERSFKILEVDSGDPEVLVKVTSEDRPAKTHTIEVQFTPVEDRPRIQTQIRVKTSLKKQGELLIDVHGFKKRVRKEITPRAVY